MVIWEYEESFIHNSPWVVICTVTSWTKIMCMFYLGTMEVVFVPAYHQGYDVYGVDLDILQSHHHRWYIWSVDCWSGNMGAWKSIHPFPPKLVIHMVTLRTSLQCLFYLVLGRRPQFQPILISSVEWFLWWIFGKPPVIMTKLEHWVGWLLEWWDWIPVFQPVIYSQG